MCQAVPCCFVLKLHAPFQSDVVLDYTAWVALQYAALFFFFSCHVMSCHVVT
jgi:hypothetical protein